MFFFKSKRFFQNLEQVNHQLNEKLVALQNLEAQLQQVSAEKTSIQNEKQSLEQDYSQLKTDHERISNEMERVKNEFENKSSIEIQQLRKTVEVKILFRKNFPSLFNTDAFRFIKLYNLCTWA